MVSRDVLSESRVRDGLGPLNEHSGNRRPSPDGIPFRPRGPKVKKILVATCVVVLTTTLAAGLWPFSFRENNNVSWNGSGGGLHFDDPGIVVSDGKFQGLSSDQGRSIELWIK